MPSVAGPKGSTQNVNLRLLSLSGRRLLERSCTLGSMMDDAEREKDRVWADLCRESGWVCRICGAVPERGQRFTDELCDDYRKIARKE